MKSLALLAGFIALLVVGCSRTDSAAVKNTTHPLASSPVTSVPQSTEKKESLPTAVQPATDAYRQVLRADGINFYSRSSSMELVPDSTAPMGASLHDEGFECGVIGANGKEIEIALLSTTVSGGKILTKDLGILRIEPADGMQAKLFATESQIKTLRGLQSTQP